MRLRFRLVVYAQDKNLDHLAALHHDFELIPADSVEHLRQLVISNSYHGVILHYVDLAGDQIKIIDQIKTFTAWLPTVILADRWNLDVAWHCGQLGIDCFIPCQRPLEEKVSDILAAIRTGGFRKLWINTDFDPARWSGRMKKVYDLILGNFPRVASISEMSEELGLHRRSFEKEFHQTFGLSYIHFLRALCMYESWHLMTYTELDNSEIADYLGYREETHFARDCRKVFHLNPRQLRELFEKDLYDLLRKSFSTIK